MLTFDQYRYLKSCRDKKSYSFDIRTLYEVLDLKLIKNMDKNHSYLKVVINYKGLWWLYMYENHYE